MYKYNKEFNERENNLITNCLVYSENNPAGLPGHNLMIIIAKLVKIIMTYEAMARKKERGTSGENLTNAH